MGERERENIRESESECVCVSLREREKERESERQREREREREGKGGLNCILYVRVVLSFLVGIRYESARFEISLFQFPIKYSTFGWTNKKKTGHSDSRSGIHKMS